MHEKILKKRINQYLENNRPGIRHFDLIHWSTLPKDGKVPVAYFSQAEDDFVIYFLPGKNRFETVNRRDEWSFSRS